MKLITKEIEKKLLKNNEMHEKFRKPHLKLFSPVGSGTWLISEIESGSIEQGNAIFFGLCDLGMGEPEMGSVSMQELASVRLPFGLGIERDLHWEPTKTLLEYAQEARAQGRIVEA
tara:strand:+ start:784 stop:1131 length:348 start_codon:yes stop_codon:yes gene_type:complete